MFLPSHLHTSSSSDQKVPAPTGSGSATLNADTDTTFHMCIANADPEKIFYVNASVSDLH